MCRSLCAPVLALAVASPLASAEDTRAQYPGFLTDSYFGAAFGYIDYPFGALQLEPGYRVEAVEVPHAGGRLTLFGHEFGRLVSAQLLYMRPVEWVRYKNVNSGLLADAPVFMNVIAATARGTVPLHGPLSLSAEAGLAYVSRTGFGVPGADVVKHATYPAPLLAGGLGWRLGPSWELEATATYVPGDDSLRQPHTFMIAGGFAYTMRALAPDVVERSRTSGYSFPPNLVQVGYATDSMGTGVNHFFTSTVPIFWASVVDVGNGATIHYQRNLFHRRKVFSFDWGASLSTWRSATRGQSLATVSAYPLFRFTPLRLSGADVYVTYSLLGPSWISRVAVDGRDTGRHFTFQDLMGLGAYLGPARHLNAEIRIGHYSNGNIFPPNPGVQIPLTFVLGYAF